MPKLRVIHREETTGYLYLGVTESNGAGVIFTIYPNGPHMEVEHFEGGSDHVFHSFVRRCGTPDPGSGLHHPEMSYDLWRSRVTVEGLKEAHLYGLWLIGQPPESVSIEDEDAPDKSN